MKFNKYSKIGQFRNVISEVKNDVQYKGTDSEGNATIDESIKLPNITFKGTVKLHGTNAAVSYNSKDGIKIQSRTRFISVGNDNYGFASFVKLHEKEFMNMFEQARESYSIDLATTIIIYGEWAGKGIQSGVDISEFERSFYIIGLKVCDGFENKELNYTMLNADCELIYNIDMFDVHYINIDFNNPQLSQNTLIELTSEVEKECPVSRFLGKPNTIGEGLVWKADYNGKTYKFKVKGAKHATSKIKTLAPIDVESVKDLIEFAEYTVTDSRVEQGIKEVFGESEVTTKGLGDVIKWVINDILVEEEDTIVKNGIDTKKVGGYLARNIKSIFFNRI